MIAAHPDYAEAYNSLGVMHARRPSRTRPGGVAKMLELDPTSAKAYENLAADELSAGELRAGYRRPAPRRSISTRNSTTPCYNLGMALDAAGRPGRSAARSSSVSSAKPLHNATRPTSASEGAARTVR